MPVPNTEQNVSSAAGGGSGLFLCHSYPLPFHIYAPLPPFPLLNFKRFFGLAFTHIYKIKNKGTKRLIHKMLQQTVWESH